MVAIIFGCSLLLHILPAELLKQKHDRWGLKSFPYIATIMWIPNKGESKNTGNEKFV